MVSFKGFNASCNPVPFFRAMIIIITLHNLSLQSAGLSHYGFFHFSNHIANFIDKNWGKFFPNEKRRKRKNLLGTIAGILSQHSPQTFTSGTESVGSIGWWKLSKKWTPREHEMFYKNRVKKDALNIEHDDDDEPCQSKRLKVEENIETQLENCFLDTEDDLLKEIDQFQEDLATSGSAIKFERIDETNTLLEPSNLNNSLEFLRDDDDDDIYEQLKTIIDSEEVHGKEIPSWIRQFYRKMNVKKLKELYEHQKESETEIKLQKPTHFDKFCSTSHNPQQDFLLAGSMSYDMFQSPYSNRILHPFIYRDKKLSPRWLKLMCELKYAVSGGVPERSTIDFCYAKPQHIPAVNSLLQRTFWSGIDMSDSLSYPDFTVVALYKKLVVGCAFLLPDVCHNEAYISFLAVRPGWDRCGIATFMLYHLTQTSHGKDITLHVSASNPAICLYQKFGFKTEEFALDFYEKYLPPDSPHSPHALFLRLTR